MTAYFSTVTTKGQFTMPAEIRRALNLLPGDEIEFVALRDGRVFMRPLNAPPSAFFDAVSPRPAVFGSDEEALDAAMAERNLPTPQAAE